MGRLSENSVVSIKNKSFSVTAEVEVPDAGANGVIIAQGGRFGGWCVYAKDGKAKFAYNVLGIHLFTTEAESPIPAGKHQVRMLLAFCQQSSSTPSMGLPSTSVILPRTTTRSPSSGSTSIDSPKARSGDPSAWNGPSTVLSVRLDALAS